MSSIFKVMPLLLMYTLRLSPYSHVHFIDFSIHKAIICTHSLFRMIIDNEKFYKLVNIYKITPYICFTNLLN